MNKLFLDDVEKLKKFEDALDYCMNILNEDDEKEGDVLNDLGELWNCLIYSVADRFKITFEDLSWFVNENKYGENKLSKNIDGVEVVIDSPEKFIKHAEHILVGFGL